jgi:hypothetical protein
MLPDSCYWIMDATGASTTLYTLMTDTPEWAKPIVAAALELSLRK